MIAYDTNILIYALEGTSSWAEAAQAIVQQGERDGAIDSADSINGFDMIW